MSETQTSFTGVVLPVFYVKDTLASVRFYRDVCGFSVASFFDEEAGVEVAEWTRPDPPVFVRMQAAAHEFALHLIRPNVGATGGTRHYFEVRDVECHRDEISGRGGVPSDVLDLPWMALFSVIDPDGHTLYFQEPNPDWKTGVSKPSPSGREGGKAESCSAQILLSNRLLVKWLSGFESDRLRQCPSGLPNCALWHAGHIAGNRRAMGRQIGCALDEPEWLRLFDPGTRGVPSEAWPDPQEVMRDLTATAERLSECLEANRDRLGEAAKSVLGEETVTVCQNLLFLFYHEAFHSGQIRQTQKLLAVEA